MSLRKQKWWPDLIEELEERSIMALARAHKVDPAKVVESLLAESRGGSAIDEPWWPEAQRIACKQGVRRAARIFQTTPRRIRRALARAGVRVGGQNVIGRPLAALTDLHDRLGKEPDHVLATHAGLAVEAIQGERRRLGVAAFRPQPGAGRSATQPDLVPQSGLAAPRSLLANDAVSSNTVSSDIVASDAAASDAAASDAAASDAAASEPESSAPALIRIAPAPAPARVAQPRAVQAVPSERRRVVRRRPAVTPAPAASGPSRAMPERRPGVWSRGSAAAASRISGRQESPTSESARPSFKIDGSEQPVDSERLLAARAARRRGRTRIVRRDTVEIVESETIEAPKRVVRRRKKSTGLHGEVREIQASELAADELMRLFGGAAVEPSALAPAAAEPAAVEPAAVEPDQLESVPRTVFDSGAASAQLSLGLGAPVPGLAPPRSTPPRSTPPRYGWKVVIDGQALPMLIVADDIAIAAAHAARHVPADVLAGASIFMIGDSLNAVAV